MKFAIEVVTLGEYADPRLVVKLAQAAESAGWEGLFVWDYLAFVLGTPSGDPWVILSAAALATKKLKLGTFVTPVPRRRPYVLANTLATLDVLSEGRVIFCAGIGGMAEEFKAFGEPSSVQERGQVLDSGLEVLSRLMLGETVTHRSRHHKVNRVTLSPLPVQRPRVPIWIGGDRAPALRRAARWDGWAVAGANVNGTMAVMPEQIAKSIDYIHKRRPIPGLPFDVAMNGFSRSAQDTLAQDYAAAGVTWWLESLNGSRGSFGELISRVKAGPPRG